MTRPPRPQSPAYNRWSGNFILRNWIRKKATEAVRDAVTDAARGATQSAANPDPTQSPESEPIESKTPELPPPCHVGIVFGHASEAGGILERLQGAIATHAEGFKFHQGGLNGRSVVAVVAGDEPQLATEATETLIEGHHPQWIVSAGFAGALTPELVRGDIVMADQVLDREGHQLALDLKIQPESLATISGVSLGGLLSIKSDVRSVEEKKRLAARHPAVCVDLQSYSVAEVCRRQQVKLMAIRVIRDALDDELPGDIRQLLEQTSVAGKAGAVTGAIFRRPSSVKDMWQLKEDALAGSERLAKFLINMLEQLVPPEPRTDA